MKMLSDVLRTFRLMKMGFHSLPSALQKTFWGYSHFSLYSDTGTIYLSEWNEVKSFRTELAHGKFSFRLISATGQQEHSATKKSSIDKISSATGIPEQLLIVLRVLAGGDLRPIELYDLANSQVRKQNSKLISVSYPLLADPNETIHFVLDKVLGCIYQIALRRNGETFAVLHVDNGSGVFDFDKMGKQRCFVAPAQLDVPDDD